MTLHEVCINSLNHEITKALACGARIESTLDSRALARFGLLHFFVVSGAHFNFIHSALNPLSKIKWFNKVCLPMLFLFTSMCQFSPPVLRAFLHQFFRSLENRFLFFCPSVFHHLLSYVFCTVLYQTSSIMLFSTNLSFVFGLLVDLNNNKTPLKQALSIYLTASPFLFFIFGVPHISTVLLTPLVALFVCGLLMPLSLASTVMDHTESFPIHIWWFLKDFIEFTSVFFNHPYQSRHYLELISTKQFFIFNLVFIFTISLGGVLWRRKSFVFC